MPITKQAIKKMHHDRARTKANARVSDQLKKLVKTMRKNPSKKTLSQTFQALDKAAKHGIVHANRAARLKSRLSRLIKK